MMLKFTEILRSLFYFDEDAKNEGFLIYAIVFKDFL